MNGLGSIILLTFKQIFISIIIVFI